MSFLHDQPASEDAFNRRTFAEGLSRALSLPKGSPGLVVGIEGEWGSGKSTVIGFIKENLARQNPAPILMDFNPWMVSGSTALVEILISQLAAAVGSDPISSQAGRGIEAGRKLLGYVKLLKNLKYLKYVPVPALSLAGNMAEGVSQIATVLDAPLSEAIEADEATLDDIKKLLPKLDLQAKKRIVTEALQNLDRPIIVFIDDLDRLQPDEIRSIMQALKAVADFPRVTYLLAYDVNVIERSLDPQQDLSRGRSYLEKIVQISYPIPPAFPWQQRIYISKAINELLIQHRINLKTFESDRFDEAVSVAIKITRQPRDVIRLINRLNLSLPATRNEVSVCDLIVFESICLKFPEFRHALVNCPEDFIGHRFSDDDTDSSFEDWSEFLSERKDKDTDWTRHFPPEKRDNPDVLKACYFLFPYISGNRNTNLKDHLRIAVRDRLIRLFSLTAMDNIPNVVELNSLLQNPSELESAFDVDPVNYQTLLSWLDQYAGSIDLRDVDSPIASLITIFWRQVNSYAVENAALKSIVNYGLLEKYISLIAQLIRKAEQGKRVDLFKLIISTAPLSLSERFVLMAAQQHGLWPVDPNRMLPDELKLMEDQKAAIEMIQVWCEKVFEIALPDEPDELLKEPHLHSVLYRWLQLGKDPAMVFSTVKKICSSEKGLEKFVIDYSNEQSLDHDNNFGLVWDANELAVLIQRNKTLKVTHSKYVGMLRSESVINYLNERNKKLFQNLAK